MTHHYARLIAVAIATVSFSTPITAQQEPDDNSANTIIVPTEMCRGYFLIPLTLAPREGYAEDRTLWLLHDTGAGATYIDPDSIERVTGRRFRVGQRANIRNATAGIVSYDPIRIRIQELDHLSHAAWPTCRWHHGLHRIRRCVADPRLFEPRDAIRPWTITATRRRDNFRCGWTRLSPLDNHRFFRSQPSHADR